MFVAAGVGAYPVAMFHLLTHAFFKAMLFLGAGSVIHAMHHEQDMRNYGNLRKKIPYTFAAMMIGTLAITGVGIPLTGWIGFAGFASKDAVIDLRDYASIDQLAAKLAQIATSESEYNKFHAWRRKSPSEWPLKFRNLVRQVSSDLKFGICSTLKEGPSKHPPVEPFGRAPTDKCDHGVNIMGTPANQYPGRPAEWWEVLGWKADMAGEVPKVEVADPKQFLTQKCDKVHHPECWDLNMPV